MAHSVFNLNVLNNSECRGVSQDPDEQFGYVVFAGHDDQFENVIKQWRISDFQRPKLRNDYV